MVDSFKIVFISSSYSEKMALDMDQISCHLSRRQFHPWIFIVPAFLLDSFKSLFICSRWYNIWNFENCEFTAGGSKITNLQQVVEPRMIKIFGRV